VGGVNIDDFNYGLNMDQYSIELFKRMDKRVGSGPKPIEGQYRLTYGGELTFWQIARFATAFTSVRVAASYVAEEGARTIIPSTNAGIAIEYAGTPHEHYTYMSSDEPYYPGKGLVDWLGSLFD
jgi:hypothetical protein